MMGFVKSNIHMNAFTALDIVIAAYVIEKTTTSAVSGAFVVSARRAFAFAVPASSSPSLARTHERPRATRRPNVTLRARSCATRARAFVRRAVVGVARRARARWCRANAMTMKTHARRASTVDARARAHV